MAIYLFNEGVNLDSGHSSGCGPEVYSQNVVISPGRVIARFRGQKLGLEYFGLPQRAEFLRCDAWLEIFEISNALKTWAWVFASSVLSRV